MVKLTRLDGYFDHLVVKNDKKIYQGLNPAFCQINPWKNVTRVSFVSQKWLIFGIFGKVVVFRERIEDSYSATFEKVVFSKFGFQKKFVFSLVDFQSALFEIQQIESHEVLFLRLFMEFCWQLKYTRVRKWKTSCNT